MQPGRTEQEKVKQLLTEAITLLCRNSLQYEEEVVVQGLLGITLDRNNIFLGMCGNTVHHFQNRLNCSALLYLFIQLFYQEGIICEPGAKKF